MKRYIVDKIKDGAVIYFFIRYTEDMTIMVLPTKYLTHRTRAKASPNTVKRIAFSISYYMIYAESRDIGLEKILQLPYDKQHSHFTDFLQWLKHGRHNENRNKKLPNNFTCNTYLRDVFGWFQFLDIQYKQFGKLKVLSDKTVSFNNSVGIRLSVTHKSFEGYLKEGGHKGRTIEKEKIVTLLEACVNCRDQLLLLMLGETGFRIGELLGVRYTKDIDFDDRTVKVEYREDNDNETRAKYAENRRAKMSKETFEILIFYLSENRELLKDGEFLFVNISGDNIGKPEKVDTVYAMLERLQKKTGIKATPHMLRHYFANERYKNGWDILLISKALGHKNISTTVGYLDVNVDRLSKATDEFYEKNKSIYMLDKLM